MRLVLDNIQGEMKPVRRGFGKQYLVEYKDGDREFVDENIVTNKLKNHQDIKYRVKKGKGKKKPKKNKRK